MPFSETRPEHSEEYWNHFFEHFLTPALVNIGFRPYRSQARTGKITKDIVRDLAYCELVLAVLTDNNPNVWYELGIRHSSRRGTIMLLQEKTQPAFDVGDYGILFYRENDSTDLESQLRSFISSVPRDDSPVADFLKIDVSFALNTAIGALRDVATIIRENFNNPPEALQKVRALQQSRSDSIQISIVENGSLLFHSTEPLHLDLNLFWKNLEGSGTSFYPTMIRERNGVRIGTIDQQANRITAVAFQTFVFPRWLAVVESHYYQGGEVPY